MINYVALVGWTPDDNEEIMSMDDLIEKFSLDRVSKSSGVFDVKKLNWVNAHYIKALDLDELTKKCIPYFVDGGVIKEDEVEEKYEWLKKITGIAQESMSYLAEITNYVDIFLDETVTLEDENAAKMLKLDHVPEMLKVFNRMVQENELTDEFLGKIFKNVQKETGNKGKNLYMPIRIALTGQNHGPDMKATMSILGKELIEKRINYSIKHYC